MPYRHDVNTFAPDGFLTEAQVNKPTAEEILAKVQEWVDRNKNYDEAYSEGDYALGYENAMRNAAEAIAEILEGK
jgi:hypothetical protein